MIFWAVKSSKARKTATKTVMQMTTAIAGHNSSRFGQRTRLPSLTTSFMYFPGFMEILLLALFVKGVSSTMRAEFIDLEAARIIIALRDGVIAGEAFRAN